MVLFPLADRAPAAEMARVGTQGLGPLPVRRKFKVSARTMVGAALLFLGLLVLTMGCAPKPIDNPYGYSETGYASWYGPGFHGKRTASGEIYDQYDYTAAHKRLPFGTIVMVEDLETHKQVMVRINDRGPYVRGRIIDLSYKAAENLDMFQRGVIKVRIQVMQVAPLPSELFPPNKDVSLARR